MNINEEKNIFPTRKFVVVHFHIFRVQLTVDIHVNFLVCNWTAVSARLSYNVSGPRDIFRVILLIIFRGGRIVSQRR